ncbi:uncharacterized protein LOC128234730 isoform X2 [Mya arenaria]|uniref:uncharacterized protein LOC128234730 isoform X2 n=1 Tax=Mya arenaria TaxID=6604 RepID=UPI0022E0496D|nr:uncharacterized protein LOC128234730 isoform X2 [Mya arenaria]
MDVLFLFIFATSVNTVVHSYFIDEQQTPWGNNTCQLAVPSLNYSHNTLSLDSTENISNLNISRHGVWIGYFQARVTYTYVGCSVIIRDERGIFNVTSLGDCMSASGCKLFGIWNSKMGLKCMCATGLHITSAATECNTSCTHAELTYPCGSETANLLSVYNTETDTVTDNSRYSWTNSSCLSFNPKFEEVKSKFKWTTCENQYIKVMCSDRNFTDDAQTAVVLQQTEGNWISASTFCLRKHLYPATYKSIINKKFLPAEFFDQWTGIVRKISIINTNDSNMPYIPDSVAILLQNGTVVFKDDPEYRQTLCQQYHATTHSSQTTLSYTSTSQSPTLNTTAPVLDRTSTLGKDEDHVTTPASRMISTGLTAAVPDISSTLDKDAGGSTVGLAAGVSVSLVLLIVITIIVLLKRRGIIPMCYTHNDETSNHTASTTTDKSFISTPILQSTTDTMHDLTASNHSYFVLEKKFDGVNNDDADQYAEPDTTDADHYDLTVTSEKDTDNDYDTTDGNNPFTATGLANENNNYNKVAITRTDEYDHIQQNGRLQKPVRQAVNEYDISNIDTDSKRNISFEDDKDHYSHLNRQHVNSSGTDNVYGKPETDGDSAYDTFGALKGTQNAAEKEQKNDYAVIKKSGRVLCK